jgi:hypothetical protein
MLIGCLNKISASGGDMQTEPLQFSTLMSAMNNVIKSIGERLQQSHAKASLATRSIPWSTALRSPFVRRGR